MDELLFIDYDDVRFDARALETLKAFKRYWKVTAILLAHTDDDITFLDYQKSSKKRYFRFIRFAKKQIKKFPGKYVYLHDDGCATLIKSCKQFNKTVIFDESELYIGAEPKTIKGKIAHFLQFRQTKKYIRLCDVISAANEERAIIMKDYFGLSVRPIVFDNVHKILDDIDVAQCSEKFKSIPFAEKKIITYFGGIEKTRGTFDLIEAVNRIGEDYFLVIAGSKSIQSEEEYYKMLPKLRPDSVIYLGFISRSEIRFLLQHSFINVSIYDMSTFNHVFCASGKVFEGLFEGVPLLTSINPPFKRICDTYGVGVSTLDYIDGIREIEEKYEHYKENVRKFVDTYPYEDRTDIFVEEIKKVLYSNE